MRFLHTSPISFWFLCSIFMNAAVDARGRESANIHGKPYKLKRLSEFQQGVSGNAHRIVDGYDGKPAILKIIHAYTKIENERVEREISYLERAEINQIFTHDKEPYREEPEDEPQQGAYTWKLVIRDIHKGYPDKDSPDLQPLYELMLHKPDLDLDKKDSVAKLKKLALAKGKAYAEGPVKLVYRDMGFGHLWTDEKISVVEFIDWDSPSVIDVSEKALQEVKKYKAKTEKEHDEEEEDVDTKIMLDKHEALDHMESNLDKYLTVEELEEDMEIARKACEKDSACSAHSEL